MGNLNNSHSWKDKRSKEIDEILDKIEKYWKKFPILRLTQVIGNMFDDNDPYYHTDKEVKRWLNRESKKKN
jgi:hypothetical protein